MSDFGGLRVFGLCVDWRREFGLGGGVWVWGVY